MPRPTSAARMGMIHTAEMRVDFRRATAACGSETRSRPSDMLVAALIAGIPDQARVESLRGKHREHHHCRKERHAGARLYPHKRAKLHQRHHESVYEHVEHRPAA